jgi:hypothetical protein
VYAAGGFAGIDIGRNNAIMNYESSNRLPYFNNSFQNNSNPHPDESRASAHSFLHSVHEVSQSLHNE